MIFVSVLMAASTLPAGDDRLVTGSRWQCAPAASGDKYTAEMAVEPGRGLSEKKLLVHITGGQFDLIGYGSSKADHFNKNGSELVSEFGQGFYNQGLQIMTHWDRDDPAVEADITTRNSKTGANPREEFYAFRCTPLLAERGL